MNRLLLLVLFLFTLTSCSIFNSEVQDGYPTQKVDVTKIPNAAPKVEPKSKYGNPKSYVIDGKKYYVLKTAKGYDQKGIASWYGTKFHGHLTSTHEVYDMFAMTAASTDLPLPTFVEVTDLENGRNVIVKVNDRGPFDKDRILDLSYAAAKKLGYANKGTALVEVKAIDPRTYNKNLQLNSAKIAVKHTPVLYLQMGAFTSEIAAETLKLKLAAIIKDPVNVDVGTLNNKPLYRVRIGPLKNVAENDAVQKKLESKGFLPGYVVIV